MLRTESTSWRRLDIVDSALVLELSQMIADIAGIIDPTPISDSIGMLIAVRRGSFSDAVTSSLGLIPFIGDLAKTGKLGRYAVTLEKLATRANCSRDLATRIKPIVERAAKAIELLPPLADATRGLKRGMSPLMHATSAINQTIGRIDIRSTFVFRSQFSEGRWMVREARGALGVPSKVINPSSRLARQKVSQGTGDDAGHLIAGRFGAPGTIENLGRQNWIANRGSGTWFRMEEHWAEKLERGFGIRVRVREFTKANESRPFRRLVEWEEVSPTGRISKHSMEYLNATSQKSRNAAGEATLYGPNHRADVYRIDEYLNQ